MRNVFFLTILVIVVSGCSSTSVPILGPTATPTSTQVPTATPIPPTATPTNTPLPTDTPTPTLSPTPTNTATPTPTSTSTPTPTPIPAPVSINGLEVLFADDFNNPLSGWDLDVDGSWGCDYDAEYLNDEMVLNVNDDGDCSRTGPHLRFDNFVLEVIARWSGGAIGGRYGVQFRYQDEENYYGFYLHNDGRYLIGKRANNEWIPLIEDFSDAIDRTGAPNLIHIEVKDRELLFFVNGQFINVVHDVDHSIGDIVLFASAPEGSEFFEASFDNVVITKHP